MLPIQLLSAVFLLGTPGAAFPVLEQQPLGDSHQSAGQSEPSEIGASFSRALSGRFLHITDLHPDPYYEPGTTNERACHRGDGSAGYFGAEGTECDSPYSLINATFRWIEDNLKDKIDFVIWTGDSARHDNDEKNPRTANEIITLNEFIADKFIDTFQVKKGASGVSIPVVPTFGNNDIMPHNIFKDGPNRWTKQYKEVWHKFIPEHQLHSFVEGGWFVSEVIPDTLAVISLNTLYFFDSNSAVDGCAAKSEPGYEHIEWLRVQLELLRARNLKAIIIGHVPPARSGSKRSWDETCWQKYTLFVNRFRDVVVGSAYGHMNIDHFMLQDSHKVKIAGDSASAFSDVLEENDLYNEDGDISVQSRFDYLSSLREDWSSLPTPPKGVSRDILFADEWVDEDMNMKSAKGAKPKKKRFLKKIGGPWAERYSVSLVSPSVVPNFFPTLRVVEYNITGLEATATWSDSTNDVPSPSFKKRAENEPSSEKKGKNKKKQPNFNIPEPPSASAPPGPAYSNQALTWLGYTQYYANLTEINAKVAKQHEMLAQADSAESDEARDLKHDAFKYEIEYDTKDAKFYNMDDLTVRSFFKLAKQISKNRLGKTDNWVEEGDEEDLDIEKKNRKKKSKKDKKKKKPKNRIWRKFLERAFVGSLGSDELDDIE
ncbi:endopolyphosphatase [Aspergillus heteromorphus CBS 117.55]|uniref:Endopolyphosphatase n=1 Tax=Aspergillus heteromorphus CBS 117.55 TaxID=1448321 RepID=A0A317W3B7_9EURO|nr:endopolyphosphatase [Aspergillus heteromorphus CBS 117.55]PWY80505.1 endopolyphosphatase [Aspergillus heteromorphus CBS 117.55]